MLNQEIKELIIPYNFEPRSYELPFLRSPKRFKMCVWHRRSGKSKTALNEQIAKIFRAEVEGKKAGTYYYILPTYKQAKQVIWDSLIREHVPMMKVDKLNDSELAIYYKNGSIQRFVGAEDPQKHRGINPIDVVFDEFAEQKSEMWSEIIQPVLRENNGTAAFIFTFRGRNHAWQLYNQVADNPEWFREILTVDDTKAISEPEIQEAKKLMPYALFRQELYCDPAENASAFFRRILENVNHDAKDHSQHQFQIGVDLAKYQDWTVVTPFCLNCFQVLPQERFNNVDWNLQKSRIEVAALKYNNAKIWTDATGVGDPITEDLQRTNLAVEGYKFTEISRRQLLDNLSVLLEQDKIKLPDDEGLIAELQSFQFTLNEAGKIKVNVPEGMTDDRVFSLALAVWEAKEPTKEKKGEEYKLYVQDFV